jgi:hypothetical protein
MDKVTRKVRMILESLRVYGPQSVHDLEARLPMCHRTVRKLLTEDSRLDNLRVEKVNTRGRIKTVYRLPDVPGGSTAPIEKSSTQT